MNLAPMVISNAPQRSNLSFNRTCYGRPRPAFARRLTLPWPKKDKKEHSLVWFPMSADVGFIAAIGATEKIHTPLFLSGDDLAAFKRTGAVNSSDLSALRYSVWHL